MGQVVVGYLFYYLHNGQTISGYSSLQRQLTLWSIRTLRRGILCLDSKAFAFEQGSRELSQLCYTNTPTTPTTPSFTEHEHLPRYLAEVESYEPGLPVAIAYPASI